MFCLDLYRLRDSVNYKDNAKAYPCCPAWMRSLDDELSVMISRAGLPALWLPALVWPGDSLPENSESDVRGLSCEVGRGLSLVTGRGLSMLTVRL